MKAYPMKLEAVCKDILWGGTLLGEQYGKPAGKIAEAWELTVHPEGVNRIENGAYAGKTLVLFAKGGRLLGLIALADSVREDSKDAISR